MITNGDLRRVLVEGRTLAGAEDIGDDTEIVVDSFSLAWLQYSLMTEFGIELDIREVRADEFSSINRIVDYVNALAAGKSASVGEGR
jgi:acyl carrier protein